MWAPLFAAGYMAFACGDGESGADTHASGGLGGQPDAGATGGIGAGGAGAASSGGVGGTGGATVTPLGKCGAFCEHIVAAGCPDDSDLDTCVLLCNLNHEASGSCLPKYEAFEDCVIAAPLSCVSGDADLFAACTQSNLALSACLVCEVEDDDEVCDKCEKSNCCTENAALYGVAEYPDYLKCVQACEDPQCLLDCETDRPAVAAALEAIEECETKHCPAC